MNTETVALAVYVGSITTFLVLCIVVTYFAFKEK